jgi:hypothetical protein
MNHVTAYLSVTILMTAMSYGMDTKKVAIKELNPYELLQHKVTLPKRDIITQRIQELNLPDTIIMAKFDKEKLINYFVEFKSNTVTINDLLLQISHIYMDMKTAWGFNDNRTGLFDNYKNYLRPHCLNILKVLLQDHPEHETLVSQIDKLKLI